VSTSHLTLWIFQVRGEGVQLFFALRDKATSLLYSCFCSLSPGLKIWPPEEKDLRGGEAVGLCVVSAPDIPDSRQSNSGDNQLSSEVAFPRAPRSSRIHHDVGLGDRKSVSLLDPLSVGVIFSSRGTSRRQTDALALFCAETEEDLVGLHRLCTKPDGIHQVSPSYGARAAQCSGECASGE